MSKSSKTTEAPVIIGASGETLEGSVWAEVKVTVRTGEYESATVALGQSLKVEGGRVNRRKARRLLLDECESMVVDKALAVRKSWQEQT